MSMNPATASQNLNGTHDIEVEGSCQDEDDDDSGNFNKIFRNFTKIHLEASIQQTQRSKPSTVQLSKDANPTFRR